MLIFQSGPPFSEGTLWQLEGLHHRYELFDVNDLSSFDVIGVPILIFLGLFAAIYAILGLAKVSLNFYLFKNFGIAKSNTIANADLPAE